MDRGIRALGYELPGEHAAEYLHWFHHTHIPDLMSRPGYMWAAHYKLGHGGPGNGYLALFGGVTAHSFLGPGPGQLAQRQSAAPDRMLALRRNSFTYILAEEARVDGPDVGMRAADGTPGPVIQIGNYNAASPAVEEDLGAWYAQQRLPLLASLPGCVGARKMLATVGAYKHAIVHEFASLELRERHFGPHEAEARDPGTWMGRVRPQLTHAPHSPAIGTRVWPAAHAARKH